MQANTHIKKPAYAGGLFVTVIAAAAGVGLLTDADTVSQGIKAGLAICGNVLIPSLFPFMVLSGFISRTDSVRILSMPLAPVTTWIYKLPANMGAIVLLGLIGGYPVGARMVAGLLERGEIDEKTARRMLCFCVNSGPSFLISAVGMGMLTSRRAGVILFATQTFATLFIGAVVSWRVKVPANYKSKRNKSAVAPAFVEAVAAASSAMLTMCAFAVLFSGILSLLQSGGICAKLAGILPVKVELIDAVLCGLFEVTSGCLKASAVGGETGFALICMFVSFSGLSVLFQIISSFPAGRIRFGGFVCIRLVHGVIAASLGVPLYRRFCAELPVWGASAAPIMQVNGNPVLVSACLIAMCTILIFCAGWKTGK